MPGPVTVLSVTFPTLSLPDAEWPKMLVEKLPFGQHSFNSFPEFLHFATHGSLFTCGLDGRQSVQASNDKLSAWREGFGNMTREHDC